MISRSSWKKKEDIFCICHLFCLLFIVYYVLSQCIVYWIHFQNIHTFVYRKTLYTSYIFLIVLKIAESQQCILKNKYTFTSYQKTLFDIDCQRISINQNNIFSNILYMYTIQWGWLGPIFGIFHDLLPHSNHAAIWHPEYMTLRPHSFD